MAPAAERAVLNVRYEDRKRLADALRTELLDGPNADKEVWFDANMVPCRHPGDHKAYKAIPLNFGAYVAISRPLTGDELKRLGRERHRRAAARGFYVLEILHPAAAFTRGPRLVERS